MSPRNDAMINGFLIEEVENMGELPEGLSDIISVLCIPSEGGRLLRVKQDDRVLAYMIADQETGEWYDIHLSSIHVEMQPETVIRNEPVVVWNDVVRAVDAACSLFYGARSFEGVKSGPQP